MRNAAPSPCLGADPELDEFMETYCQVLVKYKSDLARPFDEATVFLNNIETQLGNLCKGKAFVVLDRQKDNVRIDRNKKKEVSIPKTEA